MLGYPVKDGLSDLANQSVFGGGEDGRRHELAASLREAGSERDVGSETPSESGGSLHDDVVDVPPLFDASDHLFQQRSAQRPARSSQVNVGFSYLGSKLSGSAVAGIFLGPDRSVHPMVVLVGLSNGGRP
jgi:hypothetical protein